MNLKTLDLIITEDCNFKCSYCRQKREEKYMSHSTVEKAITYFYPFFEKKANIIFFGGEPLLAMDIIKHTVSLLQEKDPGSEKHLKYSVTTNGSLFTDEIFCFFARHHFFVLLSFDGLTQDVTRNPGSQVSTMEILRQLQSKRYPGIEFATNSVFTPGTVKHLSESLIYIVNSGVTDVMFSLDENEPWDESALMTLEREMERLKNFLVSFYREKEIIPVSDFLPSESGTPRTSKINFACNGGYDRMAVSPEENVWGCGKFHFYLKGKENSDDFRSYSFGSLDSLIENYDTVFPGILSNYSALRQDFFFVDNQFCFLCDEVKNCKFCPVSTAYATSFIGKIPPWSCRITGIIRKERGEFLKEINGINLSL
jgi:uncharacterized protein